jgi:hypothetical protein
MRLLRPITAALIASSLLLGCAQEASEPKITDDCEDCDLSEPATWGQAETVCLQSVDLSRTSSTETASVSIPIEGLRCPAGLRLRVAHVSGEGTVEVASVGVPTLVVTEEMAEVEDDWLGFGRGRVQELINDGAYHWEGDDLTGKTVNNGYLDLSKEAVEGSFFFGWPSALKTSNGCYDDAASREALEAIYDNPVIEVKVALQDGDDPCVEVRWEEADCNIDIWQGEETAEVAESRRICGLVEESAPRMTAETASEMCGWRNLDCSNYGIFDVPR